MDKGIPTGLIGYESSYQNKVSLIMTIMDSIIDSKMQYSISGSVQ